MTRDFTDEDLRLMAERARTEGVDAWENDPGTYEIVDGVAYIYNGDGSPRMMMPESVFHALREEEP